MFIVDAHLDLAYNAVRGRDVLRPADQQTPDDEGIPTVGLPDLRAGSVRLICATIFCEPSINNKPGYRDAEEALIVALRQLRWYQQQATAGELSFVTTAADVPNHDTGRPPVRGAAEVPKRDPGVPPMLGAVEMPKRDTGVSPVRNAFEEENAEFVDTSFSQPHQHGRDARVTLRTPPSALAAILLLEGADPLRTPADVAEWFAAGLRIVGLAWKRTRFAGGTGAPGPLTPEGIALVRELDRWRIIHDVSHLAEQSFWDLLELTGGPLIASHSNCRAIIPTDRQLSDAMARALISRGGVIGINFFDKFLLAPEEYGHGRATLADVVRHVRHFCDLAGNANHVGLGTDMDGGLGREQIPVEIRTSADLPRVADALSAEGFGDEDVRAVLGRNWADFFRRSLP